MSQLEISLSQGELIQTKEYDELAILEREIANASFGVKIKDMKPEELLVAMVGLIGRTHVNCGYKMDQSQVDLTVDELVSDLQKYNGLLSLAELELAFKNGWKKAYGEFFGLSNQTYFMWVNGYTWSASRLNAKKAIEKAIKNRNNAPTVSELEKERIVRDGVIARFYHYRDTKVIEDIANVAYNYLDDKGLILFTKEVKNEIMDRCRKRLLSEENSKQIGAKTLGERNDIANAIKQLEQKTSPKLKIESRKEALKMYFDQLIEMELDLKDLI